MYIWRIIMSSIIFSNTVMPVLSMCDLCAASEPFYHADRSADFHVLIYVLEGTIYVTEEDVDYAVCSGELLFLKSGVHHFGKREIPKGTRWYYVHFYMDEQDGPDDFTPDSAPFIPYVSAAYKKALPQYVQGLRGSKTEQKIADLIEYYHSDDRMKKWRINNVLHELLTEIAMGEEEHGESKTLAVRIGESLSKRYREPFSAHVLEQEFFLSYKYMAVVFKRETGTTMQKFHNSLRMNEAARLLRSTLSPVGEIAEQVGFGDMLYFSRCFRSFFGVSPTEYRRKSLPDF